MADSVIKKMVMFLASRLARIRPDIIPQPINEIEKMGNIEMREEERGVRDGGGRKKRQEIG